MPLPKPNTSEDEEEFIERCMSDDVMKDEFDDEDQRLAICQALWGEEENSMDNRLERRLLPFESVEYREDGERPKLVGHAAVFDQPAEIFGFEEVIRRGAFENTIADDDIRALRNHNSDYVLGRNRANTLVLSEDDTGLFVEVFPPDAQWARDYMVSIERGDIDQMSFAFEVVQPDGEKWYSREKQLDLREILEVRLSDVSPVTYPAYEETDVSVRAALTNAPDEVRKKLLASDGGQGSTSDTDEEPRQGLRLKKNQLRKKKLPPASIKLP